jgi:hypothetical protein
VPAREQQRPAVSLGEIARGEQLERLIGEVEQAQQVGHGDTRAADAPAELLARQPELLDEQRAGARLLDRREVLARHVLDQRELERRGVVLRAHERGHGVEAGELRGAPTAFAGDQLVGAAGERAHEDRLQDAALAQRAGQREQARLVEVLAGLMRARPDQVDRQVAQLGIALGVALRGR